jgi:putative sterol carrier protein
MAKAASAQDVFGMLDQIFDSSKASGVDAVFQFDLTGEGAAQYWVKVSGGGMEKGEGMHDAPTLTITSAAQDYIKVVNGEMAAMSAFMSGKIKIKGDMGLAMKLQSLFPF